MCNINNKTSINERTIRMVLLLILITIFIFPNQIRIGILGGNLGALNLVASILTFFLMILNYKNLSWKYTIMLMLFNLYFLVTGLFYQDTVRKLLFAYISFILPMFFIGMNFKKDTFLKFFKQLLRILNIIIVAITLFGILDFFMNNFFMNLFVKFMGTRYIELFNSQRVKETYRMYSFMGHPLFNTQLYLMFYLLNMIYSKYIEKALNKIFITIVTIIGISLTASKTGFILLIICLTFIVEYKNKIKYYLTLMFGSLIILKSGILNNIFVRFTTGGLTTGRSESAQVIARYNIFPIRFFSGYGTEFTFYYNNIINWASAAFEYPFKMFQLELGTFNALMIYNFIALYPATILLLRKQYYLLFVYLILFIDVNTYNGMALVGDYMLIFSIFTCCLLNLSKIISSKSKL